MILLVDFAIGVEGLIALHTAMDLALLQTGHSLVGLAVRNVLPVNAIGAARTQNCTRFFHFQERVLMAARDWRLRRVRNSAGFDAGACHGCRYDDLDLWRVET